MRRRGGRGDPVRVAVPRPGREGRVRAAILAAGVGSRLAAPGEERPPKCLLRFGGRSLLERQLTALRRAGVDAVAVVVGYRAELVEAELERLELRPRPRTIRNDRFEEGSVRSLWAARDWLAACREAILMDGDVLCDTRMVERLVAAPLDCFVVDRCFEPGDEPVKVCVREGVPVEFRKRIDPGLRCDFVAESVGFFRFSAPTVRSLLRRADRYVRSGRAGEPYEEAIREELLARPPGAFRVEDVTGLPWIEIDFPEDLRRAREEVFPALLEERP